jgi:hypothetical protein
VWNAGLRDLGAGLPQQRVVHGRDERSLRRQEFQHALDDGIERALCIPASLGEEAVVSRPILVLPAGRREQAGDGVPAQAGQLADGEDGGSIMSPLLCEDVHVLLP